MNAAAFVLDALGIALVVASIAVGIVFEQRPEIAQRYGTRFTRDAALVVTRIAGATLILFGSVIFIAVRHAVR